MTAPPTLPAPRKRSRPPAEVGGLPAYRADASRYVGLTADGQPTLSSDSGVLDSVVAIKLAAREQRGARAHESTRALLCFADDIFGTYREQSRLLGQYLCPIDRRIQDFLDDALKSTGELVKLPNATISCDRYGLARQMSFPQGKDEFHNPEIDSYRLKNDGVAHNPRNDKRTTQGSFHVAEYGLPIPDDKIAVPLVTFSRLLAVALSPPVDFSTLPYTSEWEHPVEAMCSLLIRPLVCPEVPGVRPEKRLEMRFFIPGGCVANIDFVESIFGNAGNANLPENDAGLDTTHWTGTTGCVILAPQLRNCRKKEMGLPHVKDATEKQKKTGMCWSDPKELYNGGRPFKLTIRDERGIMVTMLADNYFGYCKKEVKTQIGLAANIAGMAEEEHAGGALAFKASNLGEVFMGNPRIFQITVPLTNPKNTHFFADAIKLLGDTVKMEEEGHATDKRFPHIHILPEDMKINLRTQSATFTDPKTGNLSTLRVLPNHTYVHPSGYKVLVAKHPKADEWQLVGTLAEPTFCHKPSTVSGGGKSEISKSLDDAVIHGPIFIGDFDKDMDLVEKVINSSYEEAILPEFRASVREQSRPILSTERTLGSVIKLLTPDDKFTPAHNKMVTNIPNHIRAIIFAIKSCYKAEMGSDWRSHFSVNIVNGAPGHELKFCEQKLVGSYLRVGLYKNGAWRTFKMRQDFVPAHKVQMEDDITASTVVPCEQIPGLPSEYARHSSLKIAQNCEWRLFQRPDDAIHPGFDKQTEIDMSSDAILCANFEPIKPPEMQQLVDQIYFFERFSQPMQQHMLESARASSGFAVCSAKPRLVEGKPTKNPRYLQLRPDVAMPQDRYLAELGARLYRRLAVDTPCVFPVTGVLGGRRNNPPDELDGKPIRPLCVYNPIHYQELPELFMDYVCCVTGKSPSTTGAGSEGALSKGPFNAIGATADLNTMMVSMILTDYGGFSSAAGWIGPDYRVDHDISLIVPELWCRMTPQEKDPKYLIEKGFLEPIDDFEYEGRKVPASRLGYRITKRFVHDFFCRIFDNPSGVIPEEMLRPEQQGMAVYVDGIENIVQAMQKSALHYFADGIIEDACPPLKAVLHVMAYGHYNHKSIHDPEIRALFTRESLLKSDWYSARLLKKQEREVALWKRHKAYLESFLSRQGYEMEAARLDILGRLEEAEAKLQWVSHPEYLKSLNGTLGADPIHTAG